MLKKLKTFISFEGCDFSGKTTQIKLINDWLVKSQNVTPFTTYEPGNTKVGVFVRDYIKNDTDGAHNNLNLLLLMSSRQSHLNAVITKHNFVISDRYHESTLVYQCLHDNASIKLLNVISEYFIMPQFTFFIYCDDISNRISSRKLDNLEKRINHQKINNHFLHLLKTYKEKGCKVDVLGTSSDFSAKIGINEVFKNTPISPYYFQTVDILQGAARFVDTRRFIIVDGNLKQEEIHSLITEYFEKNILN